MSRGEGGRWENGTSDMGSEAVLYRQTAPGHFESYRVLCCVREWSAPLTGTRGEKTERGNTSSPFSSLFHLDMHSHAIVNGNDLQWHCFFFF
jgi:hypothetical protein